MNLAQIEPVLDFVWPIFRVLREIMGSAGVSLSIFKNGTIGDHQYRPIQDKLLVSC